MPVYEFSCSKCQKEFDAVLSVKEKDQGEAKCPDCGGTDVNQLMSSFISKTSRKS
jgi:putative FmdB family regulatory protein